MASSSRVETPHLSNSTVNWFRTVCSLYAELLSNRSVRSTFDNFSQKLALAPGQPHGGSTRFHPLLCMFAAAPTGLHLQALYCHAHSFNHETPPSGQTHSASVWYHWNEGMDRPRGLSFGRVYFRKSPRPLVNERE